ncbi:DUF2490 domain-containing protein [Tellurirhabdus rosea]|uniref:DUF2490 domain-containing protein n=1 Tax=Tellurirhabdus rosea TaxID=2674997 RepID=UPI002251881A|nr:DUF2490 domain-containing protein [Tellurirhabdus rosea]
MKNGFLLLLGLILARQGTAQPLHFAGLFPAYSQTGILHKKLLYNFYLSSTIDAFSQTVENVHYPATNLQVYLQPGLIYRLKPHLQVGAAYAFVKHNLFGLRVNENRLFVQGIYTHRLPSGTLAHRLRYEERYPFNLKTQRGSKASLFRYQLGYNLPLYDPKTRKHGFYASASHEFFLCLTGATNSPISSKNAFNGENWSYVGAGYTFRKAGRLELGYMLQNLVRNARKEHRYLHLLQVSYNTTFNLEDFMVWLYTPY